MKKVIKILIIFSVFIFILYLFDLYATRSYFLANEFREYPTYRSIKNENLDVIFHIKKTNTDSIELIFKNNSIKPLYFTHYRHGENLTQSIFYPLGKQTFFNNSRVFIPEFDKPIEQNYIGFECGTGLGVSSIKPYESFKKEVKLSDFYEMIELLNTLTLSEDNSLIERKHHQSIGYFKSFELNNVKFEWNKEILLSHSDSINFQLYTPIHSLFSKSQTIVYSNIIKVPYLEIIESKIKKSEEKNTDRYY